MNAPNPETVRPGRTLILGIVLLASFVLLYVPVMAKLVNDWSIDENYSHGFLVVPIAAYFAWERRSRLKALPRKPSMAGLIVVLLSIALLLVGTLGAEVFTTEVSMLGSLAGAILFLFGWQVLRSLLFPISFLLLMIPIPAIIFNQIAFPLQLIASSFAAVSLSSLHIPALREGNVIHLASTSLEVVEACSGIRSLVSLLTLGIVYGYFMDSRRWIRWMLTAATVPVAIVANAFRVAGTGVAAHYYGAAAADGFFHTFSGWLVFLAAFLMLFIVHHVTVWLLPDKSGLEGKQPADFDGYPARIPLD